MCVLETLLAASHGFHHVHHLMGFMKALCMSYEAADSAVGLQLSLKVLQKVK